MSVERFVQNFSGRRAVLASDDRRAVEALTPTLQKLGLTVESAQRADLAQASDILFFDGDLDTGCNPYLPPPGSPPGVPVVGLVGIEAPSRLKALMTVGATAFLRKPVYGGSVYSALFLAVNEFDRKAALAADVRELERRRLKRRHVVKAVILAMRQTGLGDDDAFQMLRREAMRARVGLEAFCETYSAGRDDPPGSSPADPALRTALDRPV